MTFLSTRKVFQLTCPLEKKKVWSSFCICQTPDLDQKSKCYPAHSKLQIHLRSKCVLRWRSKCYMQITICKLNTQVSDKLPETSIYNQAVEILKIVKYMLNSPKQIISVICLQITISHGWAVIDSSQYL